MYFDFSVVFFFNRTFFTLYFISLRYGNRHYRSAGHLYHHHGACHHFVGVDFSYACTRKQSLQLRSPTSCGWDLPGHDTFLRQYYIYKQYTDIAAVRTLINLIFGTPISYLFNMSYIYLQKEGNVPLHQWLFLPLIFLFQIATLGTAIYINLTTATLQFTIYIMDLLYTASLLYSAIIIDKSHHRIMIGIRQGTHTHLLTMGSAFGQQLTVKSNALLWVNSTPNLSLELVTTRRTSLDVSMCYTIPGNPLNVDMRGVSAEYRYWISGRPFARCFTGFSLLGTRYDVNVSSTRHHGDAGGIGLVLGYVLPIGKRWNIEFESGFGFLFFREKRFTEDISPDDVNYNSNGHKCLPTKVAIAVGYTF